MYSYEDLQKMPIGTKMSFKKENDVFIKTGEKEVWNTNSYFGFDLDEEGLNIEDIIKIEEPTYTTVFEAKEILDEEENEYLSAVIKPFKDRVQSIAKISDISHEYIKIRVGAGEYIELPYFNAGTMYKGMNASREYSIEELGL